jgi:urea carboxylase-associated protein 1
MKPTDSVPPQAEDVLEDVVVPPGSPWSRRLQRGQQLRITDLEGTQAVDFLCYNADDPSEAYNAPNTMKVNGSIFIGAGTRLLSSLARPILTVTRDTCGQHDTIGGCCSRPSNELLYGKPGKANCRDNLLAGLQRFGLTARDMTPNINWFMRVPVAADGSMAIADGLSRPGDYVQLRADMDAFAVLSNCPQVYNPANGYRPTPVRVTVTQPR